VSSLAGFEPATTPSVAVTFACRPVPAMIDLVLLFLAAAARACRV
jgi:hypothetical protein